MNDNSALFHTPPTWFEKSKHQDPCKTGIALLPYLLKTVRPSVAKNYGSLSADWGTGERKTLLDTTIYCSTITLLSFSEYDAITTRHPGKLTLQIYSALFIELKYIIHSRVLSFTIAHTTLHPGLLESFSQFSVESESRIE